MFFICLLLFFHISIRFRIKYFPEHIVEEIIQEQTLKLLYLQVQIFRNRPLNYYIIQVEIFYLNLKNLILRSKIMIRNCLIQIYDYIFVWVHKMNNNIFLFLKYIILDKKWYSEWKYLLSSWKGCSSRFLLYTGIFRSVLNPFPVLIFRVLFWLAWYARIPNYLIT